MKMEPDQPPVNTPETLLSRDADTYAREMEQGIRVGSSSTLSAFMLVIIGLLFSAFGGFCFSILSQESSVINRIEVSPLQRLAALLPSAILGVTGLGFTIGGLVVASVITKRMGEFRKILLKRIMEVVTSDKGDYYEKLTSINLENLSAYYYAVKSQTDKSFVAALGTGLLGFFLIALGIVATFAHSNQASWASELSCTSGIITEFISAVFFYLYNQTVRQMKGYHDSLLVAQNYLLSFKLINETGNPDTKAQMMKELLRFLTRANLAVESRRLKHPNFRTRKARTKQSI